MVDRAKPCDACGHERPYWLKEEERGPPPALPEDALITRLMEVAAEAKRKGAKLPQGKPLPYPDSKRLELPEKPLTPHSQLQRLHKHVSQHIQVTPCDEYHRLYWLPLDPQQLKQPIAKGAEAAQKRFGTKKEVWSLYPTDYRSAGWYVENDWFHKEIKRSKSQPIQPPPAKDVKCGVKQPWTESKGFSACQVGGVGGGLKGRNIGLYEDSFKMWKKEYRPPQYGLSQCEITRIGGELKAAKAMLRA